MIATFSIFKVQPEDRDEFERITMRRVSKALALNDAVAAGVLTDPDRSDMAYLLEVFRDETSLSNHHQQREYVEWSKEIVQWLVEPTKTLQSDSFPDQASFRHLRLAVAGSEDPATW